jgi:hypothetical protein
MQTGVKNSKIYLTTSLESALSICEAKPEATVATIFTDSNLKHLKLDGQRNIVVCSDDAKQDLQATQELGIGIAALQQQGHSVDVVMPGKEGGLNSICQQSGLDTIKQLLNQAVPATEIPELQNIKAPVKTPDPIATTSQQVQTKPTSAIPTNIDPQYDKKQIIAALNHNIDYVLEHILGNHNTRLSEKHRRRYGNKGSLLVNMEGQYQGKWYNFETSERGDLLQLIMNHKNLSFTEALEYAANLTSTHIAKVNSFAKSNNAASTQQPKQKQNPNAATISLNTYTRVEAKEKQQPTPDDLARISYAQNLWQRGKPINGTTAEHYLNNRGIKFTKWPQTLRYISQCKHSPSETNSPALLVAAQNRAGEINAVQRIYLDQTKGQKADVAPNKMTLGKLKFNAVAYLQQGKPNSDIYIAEGAETALSIAAAKPDSTVIASLSLGNIMNINIPEQRNVIICADNDNGKKEAVKSLEMAINNLQQQGHNLAIAIPSEMGTDFNDILKSQGLEEVQRQLEQAVPVMVDPNQNATIDLSKSDDKTMPNTEKSQQDIEPMFTDKPTNQIQHEIEI